MFKKIKLVVITLMLILVVSPIASISANENITYYIDGNRITFEGEGPMDNYTLNNLPSYQTENIRWVVINEGITSIGDFAFYNMPKIENVQMASTVTTIGEYAFYNDVDLLYISSLSNITSIGDYAFYGCTYYNPTFNSDLGTNVNIGVNAINQSGDNTYSYGISLERLNAAVSYLNEIYVNNSNLGFDVSMWSDNDLSILAETADILTANCATNLEKFNSIYNWVIGTQVDSRLENVHESINALGTSGQTTMMNVLCRLSGIPTAIISTEKVDTGRIKLYYALSEFTYSHKILMVYIDGNWYGCDPKSGSDQKDGGFGKIVIERMASLYLINHVDNVIPFSTAAYDITHCIEVDNYYINGEFFQMKQGIILNNITNNILTVEKVASDVVRENTQKETVVKTEQVEKTKEDISIKKDTIVKEDKNTIEDNQEETDVAQLEEIKSNLESMKELVETSDNLESGTFKVIFDSIIELINNLLSLFETN